MKTIQLTSTLSTGIEPALEFAKKLNIADTPLGGGGFGDVYRCGAVDGRRVAHPLVVKVFHQHQGNLARQCLESVSLLQQKLRTEHLQFVRAGSSLFSEYPALSGVPLLSFTGILDGKIVSGTVAMDLIAAGMEELAEVQEKDDCYRRFQSIPIQGKVDMALQLVSALDFLFQKASYLHCDLKSAALFFRAKSPQCALIDFDGGAVVRHPDDQPSTFGTLEGWIAPEVLRQVTASTPGGNVTVSLASEQWSAASAVHFLIFGCTPDFFLSEASDRAYRAYLDRYTWPEVDPSFAYFRKDMDKIHARYLKQLTEKLPTDLRRHFVFTFSKGYFDPTQRSTFSQWITTLSSAQKPAIHSFSADRVLVTDKRPVTLSWSATGAKRLELRGIRDVTGLTSFQLPVQKTTVIELVLTPQSGKPVVSWLKIEVDNRPPRIHSFTADRSFLTDRSPLLLKWNVEGAARLEITPGIGEVTGRNSIRVTPRRDTVYRLRAVSGLDTESEAAIEVKVSKQPPRILALKASPTMTIADNEVELSWKTADADSVSIYPGIGNVGPEGQRTFRVTKTTELVMTATSYFGVVSVAYVRVNVLTRTALSTGSSLAVKQTPLNPSPTKPLGARAPGANLLRFQRN